MNVLVVLPPALSTAHLEVLAAARSLGSVTALVTGVPDAATLGRHGVDRVLVPDVELSQPAAVAEAAATAVGLLSPDAVLLLSSFAGKAIAGRLAVLLDCGAVTDVTGVRREGGTVIASKAVLQGSWATECAVTRGPAVIAVRSAAFEAAEVPGRAPPTIEALRVELSAATRAITVERRTVRPSSGRPALEEARIVVAGGRGVGGDFTLVEELADALGGAVGATRVATDEGWIDHGAQIGQTGVTISPRLYVGVGISGAIHHTAALQGAEVVVVVNSDPDARIFELADFGVVGDLREVLPQAIAALRGA